MDTVEDDEDEESDEESFQLLPEKSWMTAYFSDTLDSSVDPEAEKAKPSDSLPDPSTPSLPIAETEAPYTVYVSDAVGFFAALEVDGVPTVPFGDRTLEARRRGLGSESTRTPNASRISGSSGRGQKCSATNKMNSTASERGMQPRYRSTMRSKNRWATTQDSVIYSSENTCMQVRRDLLRNVKIIGCTTTGTRGSIHTIQLLMCPSSLQVQLSSERFSRYVILRIISHMILMLCSSHCLLRY